jgi:hypothetical protein
MDKKNIKFKHSDWLRIQVFDWSIGFGSLPNYSFGPWENLKCLNQSEDSICTFTYTHTQNPFLDHCQTTVLDRGKI